MCPKEEKRKEEKNNDEWFPFVILYQNRFGAQIWVPLLELNKK